MDNSAWQARLDSLYSGSAPAPADISASGDSPAPAISNSLQETDAPSWQNRLNSLYGGENQTSTPASNQKTAATPETQAAQLKQELAGIRKKSSDDNKPLLNLALNIAGNTALIPEFINNSAGYLQRQGLNVASAVTGDDYGGDYKSFYNRHPDFTIPNNVNVAGINVPLPTTENVQAVKDSVLGKGYTPENWATRQAVEASNFIAPGGLVNMIKQIPAALSMSGVSQGLNSVGVTNPIVNAALAIAAGSGTHLAQNKITNAISNTKPKVKDPIVADPSQLQNEITGLKDAETAAAAAKMNVATADAVTGLEGTPNFDAARAVAVDPIAAYKEKALGDADAQASAAQTAVADSAAKMDAATQAAKDAIKLEKPAPIIGDEARQVVAPAEDVARKDYKSDYTKAGNPDVSFDTQFLKQRAAEIKKDFLETNPGQEKSTFANKLDHIIELPEVSGLNQLDTINQIKKDIFTETPMQYKVLENGVEGGTWRNGAVVNMFDSIAPNIEKQAVGNTVRDNVSGEVNATRESANGADLAGRANEARATAEAGSVRQNSQQSSADRGFPVDARVERIPKTVTDSGIQAPEKIIKTESAKPVAPAPKPREFARSVNLDDVKSFEQARFKYGKYADTYKKGWVSGLIAQDKMSPLKKKPYLNENAGLSVEKFTRPGQSGAENVKSFLNAAGDSAEAANIAADMIANTINKKGITTEAQFDKFKKDHAPALEALPEEARARFDTFGDALAEASKAKNANKLAQEAFKQVEKQRAVLDKQLADGLVGRTLNPDGGVNSIIPIDTPKELKSGKAVKEILDTLGDSPESYQIAEHLLTSKLNRMFGGDTVGGVESALTKPEVAQKAFNKWKNDHQSAIDLLPDEAKARISTLEGALTSLNEAKVHQFDVEKFYNEKLVKEVVGGAVETLPSKIFGAVFNGADAKPISNLLEKIKNNEQAMQGARSSLAKGIAEVLDQKDGVVKVESLMKNKNNLDKILTPEQINALRIMVKNSQSGKITEFFKTFDEGRPAHMLEKAGLAGWVLGQVSVPVLAAVYGTAKAAGSATRTVDAIGRSNRMRMMEQAILNPDVARAIAKYDAKKLSSGIFLAKAMKKSMIPAAIGTNINRGNEDYVGTDGFKVLDDNGNPIKRKNYKNGGVVQ